MPRHSLVVTILLVLPLSLAAQQGITAPEGKTGPAPEGPMTLDRLDTIIGALDPEAQTNGRVWHMTVNDLPLVVVTDIAADRMRVMAPVRKSQAVTPEDMRRLLQANFDTALDARYAIANDILWSTYIHPLRPLEKDQFVSGVGQVVNLAQSYGSLYSGGALQYGGGDSGALQRRLIDDLLGKSEDI